MGLKVTAVVPARNEAGSVGRVVESLRPFVGSVIVVDDGSSDDTGREAAAAGALVLRHRINRGQGAALRTGTEMACRLGADIVVHFDADGQHDPESLPALIRPLAEGEADMSFGSRFLGIRPEGMPPVRRALLFAARIFNWACLSVPFRWTDPQSGLRAIRSAACADLDFRQDGMAHCSEILDLAFRSGRPLAEVPVLVTYSRSSLAKGQSSADALKIAWQLFLGIFSR